MLLSFRVSNFKSIKDEQEFSFLGSSAASNARSGRDGGWDESVGTLAGIFGANASGKSNVLKALAFMRDAVTRSYPGWAVGNAIPVDPFALSPEMTSEPSLFEAIFQMDGIRYQYGFRLTSDAVLGEWLYAYPSHRRQVWFERDASASETWYFGKSFTGRNKIIADLTKPTALFLSVAAANNHKLAITVVDIFRRHLHSAWPTDRAARASYTRSLVRDDESRLGIVQLLRFADLGIGDVRVRKEPPQDELQLRQLTRILQATFDDDFKDKDELVKKALDAGADKIEFGHFIGHGDDIVYLPVDAESFGTQAWFALIGPILRAISRGGTLAIDEIDASLHPHLTAEILRVFREPTTNPRQAQLLFTSHDAALLGGLLGDQELTRDQVWLTEKKADGATVLYPLTDFSPRKTENIERGYLQGRYGAVPYLDRTTIDHLADRVVNKTDHATELAEDELSSAAQNDEQ